MFKKNKIDHIFTILAKNNSNPRTELNYKNNFTLLVAIILSAQSTDLQVNKVTKNLFEQVTSPQEMLILGIDNLKQYIRTLGLFNNKAKNIIALSQMLIKKYNNQIPETIRELEQLPGVGSKTARVYLNCAYNLPLIAVDTHVFRVSKRLGITSGNTVSLVEKELNEIVPEKFKVYAHHWLILHGRYTCKARKPSCLNCKISKYCNYYQGSEVDE